MIPAKFDYVRPSSVGDAVRALAEGGEDAKVIAGGQSLLPLLRLRLAYPELLVDVGSIGDLRGVRDEGGTLLIGALTTHDDAVRDPLIAQHIPGEVRDAQASFAQQPRTAALHNHRVQQRELTVPGPRLVPPRRIHDD